MHFALSGLILGAINIAIIIAILVLVGVVIVWAMHLLGFDVPQNVQRAYMVVVALVALYLIVALLFGLPVPGPLLTR